MSECSDWELEVPNDCYCFAAQLHLRYEVAGLEMADDQMGFLDVGHFQGSD